MTEAMQDRNIAAAYGKGPYERLRELVELIDLHVFEDTALHGTGARKRCHCPSRQACVELTFAAMRSVRDLF